jgi:hypothetical protein
MDREEDNASMDAPAPHLQSRRTPTPPWNNAVGVGNRRFHAVARVSGGGWESKVACRGIAVGTEGALAQVGMARTGRSWPGTTIVGGGGMGSGGRGDESGVGNKWGVFSFR